MAYVDDMVLLAPTWHGVQQMLDIVVQHCAIISISLNTHKSVYMDFPPNDRSGVVYKWYKFTLC